jgi:Beta-1,3-glucanase
MTKVKFLRTACPFLVALLLGLGGLPMASAQAPLNLRIINNSNFQNSQVYLMFGGIAAGFDATATVNGTPNTALVLGTSYALSQISDIKLTSFRGGRVFISLGSALMSASAGTAWNPNFNNPSLPDYNTRWDKVEITYATGLPSGGANLSAQDFFSIPLQINTYTAANPDTPVTTSRGGRPPRPSFRAWVPYLAATQPPYSPGPTGFKPKTTAKSCRGQSSDGSGSRCLLFVQSLH